MESMTELLRPFDNTKYRVMNITKKGDKASVAFYIDARDVMDRLDHVVGQENWSDKYTVLAFSESRWAVECTLVVNGVAKTDVGEGDAPKDAYSDALKRAAVKFGVGRYLYDMDNGTWFPIDEYKQFTPEAKKQIDDLLRRNLARLGVTVAPPIADRKQATVAPPSVTNGNGLSPAAKAFHASGSRLYGQDWEAKRHNIVKAYTKGRTESSRDLTPDELAFLTARMDAKLQEELAAVNMVDAPEMEPS